MSTVMNEEAQNRPLETEEGSAASSASPTGEPRRETGEGSAAAVTGEATATGRGDELSPLLQKLEEATAEITAHKERYLRTVADLENYRKRALREKEEVRRQATSALVEDLLPVLDNFHLGLNSAASHEGGAAFAEGFKMILSQMRSALRQNGVEEMNPQGQPFDPNFHEALAHVSHESVPDGHIIEVQRVGYKLHERLLRPAAVVISSGPAAQAGVDEAGQG